MNRTPVILAFALGTILAVAGSAHSGKTPKRSLNVKQLLGKWTGNITLNFDGSTTKVPTTVTFNKNGSMLLVSKGEKRQQLKYRVEGARVVLTEDGKVTAYLTKVKLTATSLTGAIVPAGDDAKKLPADVKLSIKLTKK